MDNIVFDSVVTSEEYRKAVYFNAFKKNPMYRIVFTVGIIVYAFAFIIGFFIKLDRNTYILMVGFIAIIILTFLIIEFSIRRYIKTDKMLLNKRFTVTVSNTGIKSESAESPNNTSDYEWNQIHKAYETKDQFLLFVNSLNILLIPKNQLNENIVNDIRSTISRNLDLKYKK